MNKEEKKEWKRTRRLILKGNLLDGEQKSILEYMAWINSIPFNYSVSKWHMSMWLFLNTTRCSSHASRNLPSLPITIFLHAFFYKQPTSKYISLTDPITTILWPTNCTNINIHQHSKNIPLHPSHTTRNILYHSISTTNSLHPNPSNKLILLSTITTTNLNSATPSIHFNSSIKLRRLKP